MPKVLAIIESTNAARSVTSISTLQADWVSEGWIVEQEIVSASMSIADVFALILKHAPNHVQLLGPVAYPQVHRNPDGHGDRAGDCDAPYCTTSLTVWNVQADGSFNTGGAWPSVAVRTVSRIDTTALPVGEQTAFEGALKRNHDYRTGAYVYDGLAVLDDRLNYLDATLTPRLQAGMESIVGAGNVQDVTSAYPDETFEESYTGRSFLLGALFSGGDPFRQPDGFSGHEYYLDSPDAVCSGRVNIGGVLVYCSYGWQENTWPLQRYLIAGGSVWTLYDPWGYDTVTWVTSQTIGETVRAATHITGTQNLDTLQGDGTLKMAAQTMGISLTDFQALQAQVQTLLPLTGQISTIEGQIAQLEAAVASGPVIGTSNSATFLKADTATQGSWKSVYGADGYSVFGDTTSLPVYAKLNTTGQSAYTWAQSTSDVRALQKPGSTADRIASCFYTSPPSQQTSFTFALNLTDGLVHQIALYCLDWDGNNVRSQTIQIFDASTNALLDSQSMTSFSLGKYLVWNVKGNVRIVITNQVLTFPANAVVGGLFFH